jgi:hypothetical protein
MIQIVAFLDQYAHPQMRVKKPIGSSVLPGNVPGTQLVACVISMSYCVSWMPCPYADAYDRSNSIMGSRT